jgi:hypothetical protein
MICVSIIFLFAATILFAEDVRKEISVEDAMNALCHTWANPGAPGSDKDIYYRDGRFELYSTVDSDTPYVKEYFEILEAWSDREGNICILLDRTFSYSKYALYKISNEGTLIEIKPLFNKIPSEIDTETEWFPYKLNRQ